MQIIRYSCQISMKLEFTFPHETPWGDTEIFSSIRVVGESVELMRIVKYILSLIIVLKLNSY